MSAPFPYGPVEMGEVPHWFGVSPEDCDVRHWLPFLEPVVIDMEPAKKLTYHPFTGGGRGASVG